MSQTRFWHGAKNDGIFFIAVEDFVRHYGIVYYADLVDDLHGHSAVVKSEWSGHMAGGQWSLSNPKIVVSCAPGAGV
jgi:hypothetical protein